jgi:hypothetical protein
MKLKCNEIFLNSCTVLLNGTGMPLMPPMPPKSIMLKLDTDDSTELLKIVPKTFPTSQYLIHQNNSGSSIM